MANFESNKTNKKILLISYHFPPSTAVGALRIVNFVKKLPLFGWTPYVLTIKERYIENIDTGSSKDVTPQKIYKTSLLPTFTQLYLTLKHLYVSILKKRDVSLDEASKPYAASEVENSGSETIFKKLKRYFIALFLVLPDRERTWIVPATVRAVLEINRQRIDYILTSSPPVSVNLIGLVVKFITGVKWVADFRDPWLSRTGKRLAVTCDLSIKIERWLLELVIKKSDIVLTNTRELCNDFKNTYKAMPEEKFVFIPNGYDPDASFFLGDQNKFTKFTLTYTGGLYLGRTPEPVFKAVRDLAELGKLDLQQINIKLVGNCRHVDGYPMEKIVSSYGLETVVEILDTVPYIEAIKIIRQSHLALLFAPNLPYQIPAKVYDYMGAGTRVLALAEEGATSNIVNTTNIGKSFLATDIDGISDFIFQSVNDMKTGKTNDNGFTEQFKIEKVTENLVRQINGL